MNSKFIPLMVPDIQQQDIDAVVSVLKTGMLVQGVKVEDLENNVAKYLGVRHAIAASSGTATLHLAMVAFGIGPGDEVIVPAFSFTATANVIELVGATPVFIDVNLDTLNIDVPQIEEKITSKTKAIIPVHEFGQACNIFEIIKIAQKHNLIVIEDAACALGATQRGQFTGTFGDVGSFSFHPRKAITSGEGGLLVTNNDELANKFRVLRNHGISMKSGEMEFVDVGFNYRMTDFQAALVLSQFQRFEEILLRKSQLSEYYFQDLKNNTRILLPKVLDGNRHTWQSFHIVLSEMVDRNKLILLLKENGIGTNYGAQCIPYQKYFREKYDFNCETLFPNALRAYNKGLVLPLYGKLTDSDIHFISENINTILEWES